MNRIKCRRSKGTFKTIEYLWKHLLQGTVLAFLAVLLIGGTAWGMGPSGAVHGASTPADAQETGGETRSPQSLSLPFFFERNLGQAPEPVKFINRGRGYTLFLTPSEMVFALRPDGGSQETPSVLRMEYSGADPDVGITGCRPLQGKIHRFKGKAPSQWRTGIPMTAEVAYKNLYPGIDLLLYGSPLRRGELEYDFIVAPGADPKDIRLTWRGVESLRVDTSGNLVARMPGGGEIVQHAPRIYQEVDGERRSVEGGYRIDPHEKRVSFSIAAYDSRRPLIIDPVVVYSTYLGGNNEDAGRKVAVDPAGNTYVTGWTGSDDYPFDDVIDRSFGDRDLDFLEDDRDAFVAKFDGTGTVLLYYATLGGDENDEAKGIAVDAAGHAYVTGWTDSGDFPVASALQSSSAGDSDAFVTKLAPDGASLVYSTYLGGNSDDEGLDIALDGDTRAHVCGFTASDDFPSTSGALQPFKNDESDAFVARFLPDGSGLDYATFIGGGENDEARGIAVDAAGLVYIAGSTVSDDYPVEAFIQTDQDFQDAFVTKIDPGAEVQLLFSTYLGGDGEDDAQAVAVDAAGNAYVVGDTASDDFPTRGAFQGDNQGEKDVFVARIDTVRGGSESLLYSSYLGDDRQDLGRDIALDSVGNAWVTGQTLSEDFPMANAIDDSLDGGIEVFVASINTRESGTASLRFSTFLGGDDDDEGHGIAVDGAGGIYVTGETASGDFRLESAFQDDREGDTDAFVTKILDEDAVIPSVGGADAGLNVEATINSARNPVFSLLLSRQAVDTQGRLYISLEAPTVPQWAGLTWFRPRDELTPPYVVLVRTETGFLPDADNAYYFEGPLSPSAPDISFEIGAEGLEGQSVVFKSWYLESGIPFNNENLKVIQTVRVNID